jgi:hypothetical protein
LHLLNISINGNFSQTNTCGSSLAAGAICVISITFTPASTGTLTGSLSIVDNAGGSSQTVSLTGTGTEVKLAPAALNFGSVVVGQSSSPMRIKLTNVGKSALSTTGISIVGSASGDYSQKNTCGTSVAAGKSCTISVTFKPTTTGTRKASVSVGDNGGASPQKVSLAGTGS